MIYKVTLLKDTPTLKAGTMWKYYTENGKFDFSNQTVEAEIKIVVHIQRVRAGESRVKRRLLNGPWRAQSKVL